MKSTVFELDYPPNGLEYQEQRTLVFPIPTLKAYAVEFSEFKVITGFGEQQDMIEGQDFALTESALHWHSAIPPKPPVPDYYRLVIHFHGIRDYALLFPHIDNPALRERLGHFYEEAEVSFENGAWLAFTLMCGALYEGLLSHHFGGDEKTLEKLIDRALTAGIIDDKAANTMHSTRELRNLVHASKSPESYVGRAQAMDMRTVLDRLIKDAALWEERKPQPEQVAPA